MGSNMNFPKGTLVVPIEGAKAINEGTFEVPEEINDLLWDEIPAVDEYNDPVSLHNTFVLAAFLRGQNRAEK